MARASVRPLRNLLPILIASSVALPAFAAHPLISEDTGTQGPGKFELELGMSDTPSHNGGTFEFDPQLSYGVTRVVDVILRPSLFALRGEDIRESGARRGFGMTAVDLKWRFAQHATWTFGTRAGIDAPTAAAGLGSSRPGGHALVMATGDFSPVIVTTNLAWTRLPSDAASKLDLYRVSAGGLWSLRDKLRIVADVAYYSTAVEEGVAWPAVALLGAIFTVSKDVDVDVGWQARIKRPAPDHVLLVGFTFRW